MWSDSLGDSPALNSIKRCGLCSIFYVVTGGCHSNLKNFRLLFYRGAKFTIWNNDKGKVAGVRCTKSRFKSKATDEHNGHEIPKLLDKPKSAARIWRNRAERRKHIDRTFTFHFAAPPDNGPPAANKIGCTWSLTILVCVILDSTSNSTSCTFSSVCFTWDEVKPPDSTIDRRHAGFTCYPCFILHLYALTINYWCLTVFSTFFRTSSAIPNFKQFLGYSSTFPTVHVWSQRKYYLRHRIHK